MNRVLAKEVVEAAESRWGTSAQKYIELITLDKVSDEFVSTLKAAFKPLIEEEMVRASKMPKNEFNKSYIGKSIDVSKKVNESDRYETQFHFNGDIYSTRYVNGRTIKTILPIDEVMEKMVISRWCKPPPCRYGESRKALVRKDDGWYVINYEMITLTSYNTYLQGKKTFVKMVKEEVSKKLNEGYETKVVLDTNYRNSLHRSIVVYSGCPSNSYIVFKK